MRIDQKRYNELKQGAVRTFIHDIPHSGEISEGWLLPDGSVAFEKLDYGIASYRYMTKEEYAEAQAWRPHVVVQRANW